MKNKKVLIDEASCLTRLQRGMVVELFRAEHVITRVNDCRATAVPLSKKNVEYTAKGYDPKTGQETRKTIKFQTLAESHGISPESEIPILRRLSETQLVALGFAAPKII